MASKNMKVFSLPESLRYGRIATTLAQGLGCGMVGKTLVDGLGAWRLEDLLQTLLKQVAQVHVAIVV